MVVKCLGVSRIGNISEVSMFIYKKSWSIIMNTFDKLLETC